MTRRHSLVRAIQIFFGITLGLFLACPVAGQRGAMTRPRNLAHLVEQASVIVRGHVVSAQVEPHPDLRNLSTVVVTLRVQETLKGQAETTFTFRQFIWDIRDRYDAAGYRKGEELVLLMNAPTRLALSSPVGLDQGRFHIWRDAEGKAVAINGHGNVGLFTDLEPQLKRKHVELSPRLSTLARQHRAGPMPLDDFRDFVRQLAGTH